MRSMPVIESILMQVRRLLSLIDELEQSEFPYEDPREALGVLRDLFKKHERELANSIRSEWLNNDLRDLYVPIAAQNIYNVFPLLGFILRSTNIRNAFEAWGPLRRLAQHFFRNKVHLLLSSEWDFSPYTLVGCGELPGFVLIGFPASESDTPFLLPLAGHELGHTVWHSQGLDRQIISGLKHGILKEIRSRWDYYKELFAGYESQDIDEGGLAWPLWQQAAGWAKRQACELFCDFFGLRIFGEAYLHAFSYLLAPQRDVQRPFEYPNSRDRVSSLVKASGYLHIRVPDGFSEAFHDLVEPSEEERTLRLLLEAADWGRRKVESQLLDMAESAVQSAGLILPAEERIRACLDEFKQIAPAERSGGIAVILNAGWQALLTPDFFPLDVEAKKSDLLSDLILKSLEILEIEERIKEYDELCSRPTPLQRG